MNDWLWTDWARLWNEGAISREADPPDYRAAVAMRRERRLTDRRLVLARVEAAALLARGATLTEALRDAEEWARRIAEDERVEGWVHGQDYGLYLLLADCPVEFGVLYSQPAHATDEAERAAISATPTGEA